MTKLITNKVNAIKELRAFCKTNFGSDGCLKHAKDLVENLAEEAKKEAANSLSDSILQLIPGTIVGSHADWEVELLRSVVEEAFKLATGREIFVGTLVAESASNGN